jgi:hypothetical protein
MDDMTIMDIEWVDGPPNHDMEYDMSGIVGIHHTSAAPSALHVCTAGEDVCMHYTPCTTTCTSSALEDAGSVSIGPHRHRRYDHHGYRDTQIHQTMT